MNCPNCGIEVAEGSHNCHECGYLLAGAAPAQQQPAAPVAAAAPAQAQPAAPMQPQAAAPVQPQAPAPAAEQQANYQPPGQPQGYQQSQQNYQPQYQPQAGYQQQPQFQQPAPAPAAKDTGTAVLLELVGGGIFQVFGIGNIYAGSVGIGIALMISYWVLQGINALLTIILVGFVTLPLTWILYMVVGPILAASAAKKTQGL